MSAAAQRDRAQIQADRAGNFGIAASLKHMAKFERLFALLREQPFAGPARPDNGLDVRLLVNPPPRVLYRVRGEQVVIGRVLHASRDVHRGMGRR